MTSSSTPDALGDFNSLLATMRRLRDPEGGCPWDLEQTHASLRNTLLEESYETLEALDSGEPSAIVEELGDLLLQVVFHAQIGSDQGTFTIRDVVRQVDEKLRRRHPHVFGDAQVGSAEEVKEQWEMIKAEERRARGQEERSLLSGVPRTMPALAYAQAIQARTARVGFDGENLDSLVSKAARGLRELLATVPSGQAPASQDQWEQALGEVLFAVTGAARWLGLDAEEALRVANNEFSSRFAALEALCRERGLSLATLQGPVKASLWLEAGASGT